MSVRKMLAQALAGVFGQGVDGDQADVVLPPAPHQLG
jgi:hypothetical protein